MTNLYPMMVDIQQLRCVVIGGGPVATRKVRGLLDAGAHVTVVSPEISETLAEALSHDRLEWVHREASTDDVEDADVVFLATSNAQVNTSLEHAARGVKALVNRADIPNGGMFQVPAVIRRGDVTVAVSSGGRSPAFARLLKNDLEQLITDEHLALLEVIAEARIRLQATGQSQSGQRWRESITDELRSLIRDGHRAEAVDHLVARVSVNGQAQPS